MRRFVGLALVSMSVGCAGATAPPGGEPQPEPEPAARLLPEEVHLADLEQLTFGGENAEAYWSFDGTQLSLQARAPHEGCDKIYRLQVAPSPGSPVLVSIGRGATTCAHFLPGGEELIYASTHLGSDECPPRPDHSQGYVWALYDTYDIFRARADGTGEPVRLTDTPGYDAEGTVCGKDGSILFTSVRDGDLDLYRMDADGKNVRRLTDTPGYDGGAFFSADCSKIVWRASRPRPGKELDDYRALLAKGLVRPSKLELWVANADGSEPVQVTYLDAASFAPFFFPSGDRIIFSSNHGDPNGRDFDIFAVNVDGTGLERITYALDFDGFPMFSPDGRHLAFSSNRANAPGSRDTNVFVARWVDTSSTAAGEAVEPPDRLRADASWLADPARGGRGIGTAGLEDAGAYIERRFRELGLDPAGESGGYRQPFRVATSVAAAPETALTLAGRKIAPEDLRPLAFSAQGEVQGPVVLAGHGIRDESLGIDDYAKLDARGKIVLVRRFVPDTPAFEDREKQRRFGDLRYKAWVARERGAKALLVVDWPESPPGKVPAPEAPLPALAPEGPSDAGIPVVAITRRAAEPLMKSRRLSRARVRVALRFDESEAFNVVARVKAAAPDRLDGVVVIGAHYDHLGLGGRDSLAPDRAEPHHGADDNASGTAAIIEAARTLAARAKELRRDVLVVAFSGEETGALGSSHFTKSPPPGVAIDQVVAMLNLDMVGRMRANRLTVLGVESAAEWRDLVNPACDRARVDCTGSGDGYGPSDQMPFYAAGVPVLHLFTGAHSDYHKPSDTPDRLNHAGLARVSLILSDVAAGVANRPGRLTYRTVPAPAPRGDVRSFNASLGTIPDYAGPPKGVQGVLLAGVRQGGAAELGGMRRGDVLIRLGKHPIGGVEDLMFALNASKPGETVTAVVLRDGKETSLEVTFQEGRRR